MANSQQINLSSFGQYLQTNNAGDSILGPPTSGSLATLVAQGTGNFVIWSSFGNATNGQVTGNFDASGNCYLLDNISGTTFNIGGGVGASAQIYTNNNPRLTINSAGNATFSNNLTVTGTTSLTGGLSGNLAITGTGSGPAIKATGPSGGWAAQFIGSSVSGNSYGLSIQAGLNSFDMAIQIANWSTSAVFEQIYGDGHGWIGPSGPHSLSWDTLGDYSISVPAAGGAFAFQVNGGASQWAQEIINGTATAGQSKGLFIGAGTNSSDYAFYVSNAAQTATYQQVNGDGSGLLGPSPYNINWNSAGNYIISVPASGVALTVNGVAANPPIIINGTANASYAQFSRSGTRVGFVGSADSLVSGGSTSDLGVMSLNGLSLGYNNGVQSIYINTNGDVGIATPSSGNSLTVNAISGNYSFIGTLTGGTNNPGFYVQSTEATGKTTIKFTGSSNFNGSIAVGNTDAIVLANSGAVTIAAPSSGVALTANGFANQYAAHIVSSSTSGQALGLFINGGTTSADYAFLVNNQANTFNMMYVLGNGESFIQAPATATAGLSGCWQIGYLEVPTNNQSANYTLVMSDRGKCIQKETSSAITFTIPANSSVPFPIGTTISFLNDSGSGNLTIAITTDSLLWSPSGASGTRTIAPFGLVTIRKNISTQWYITGTGIS